ncbi:hypothetical protein HZB94_00695 [Candidatus Falkowbacteria bacterium]|nr:hypothetical protein [Candidatus Falkowbacteria bacterium]
MPPTLISPNDSFVCPKTDEKIDIEKCIQRYVTANTLGKKHLLCVDCEYGKKNRARMAASLNDSEEAEDNIRKIGQKIEDDIKKRVVYRPLLL